MATRVFTGNAKSQIKILRAAAPVSTDPVRIGLPNGPFVELGAAWNATNIANAWNSINHGLRQRITATVSSTAILFTGVAANEDFHIRAFISGAAEADLPIITEDQAGDGPSFFMSPDNWQDQTVPSSEDTIIIDNGNAGILYDIDLVQQFTKYDVSGGFVRWQLADKKKTFVQNQKVWVQSSGTLPSGLSAQYYYIRNPTSDGLFHLSTGASDAGRITSSDAGTGTHKVGLKDITMIVEARFPGGQVGLPIRRFNANEYLPRAMNCWFKQLIIGQNFLGGNGLSFGDFDCEDSAVSDGVIVVTSSNSNSNVPAVLLRVNNSALVLKQKGGDVGVCVYPDQVGVLDHIEQDAGRILICNTTMDNPSRFLGEYKFYNSTVPGVMNKFTP